MIILPRLRLLLPFLVLASTDVGLTLNGQSSAYWHGDYSAAREANPLAKPFLERGPAPFLGFGLCWVALASLVFLTWRHPLSGILAKLSAILHALGGAAWILRMDPEWGWAYAVIFLGIASELSLFFWRSPSANSPSSH
jgi:hypothetical protein